MLQAFPPHMLLPSADAALARPHLATCAPDTRATVAQWLHSSKDFPTLFSSAIERLCTAEVRLKACCCVIVVPRPPSLHLCRTCAPVAAHRRHESGTGTDCKGRRHVGHVCAVGLPQHGHAAGVCPADACRAVLPAVPRRPVEANRVLCEFAVAVAVAVAVALLLTRLCSVCVCRCVSV